MPQTNPYQVQETDKDLLTLSARLGVPFPTLKNLNPSITSISQGQFINVPKLPSAPPPAPSPSTPYGPPAGLPLPQYNAPSLSGIPSVPQTYNTPGSLAAPYRPPTSQQPTNQPLAMATPYISPGANVAYLQSALQNAKDPSQLPPSVAPNMVAAAGYTPEQMLAAGYTMQGSYWVHSGAGGTSGMGGSTPQSGNNWQTNPALRMIVFNRNAKNKHSTFTTNLKWAQNAWKRSRRGMSKEAYARFHPGNPVRADTPSTTLDLVLGT